MVFDAGSRRKFVNTQRRQDYLHPYDLASIVPPYHLVTTGSRTGKDLGEDLTLARSARRSGPISATHNPLFISPLPGIDRAHHILHLSLGGSVVHQIKSERTGLLNLDRYC